MTTENRTLAYRRFARTLKTVSLACVAACSMVSCYNETIPPQSEFDTPLLISAGVGQLPSRNAVTGNVLGSGSSIGVTVVDKSGTDYQEQGYHNVCYTASTGSDGSQQWTSTDPIMLSGESGTLYAYYPYRANTDIENINIDLAGDGVEDWMYATEVTELSSDNSHAQIKLNHALAKLKISLVKGNFVGEGKVSTIALTSTTAATGATLNARTGQLSNIKSAGTKLVYPVNQNLSDVPVEVDMLFVPTQQEANIKIDVTVDNKHYTATSTTSVTTTSGQSYSYTLVQNNVKLEISRVTVTPWHDNPQGTLETDKVK